MEEQLQFYDQQFQQLQHLTNRTDTNLSVLASNGLYDYEGNFNEENDSDAEIDNYHNLLMESYVDESKLQEYSKDIKSLRQSKLSNIKKMEPSQYTLAKSACSTKTYKTTYSGKASLSKYSIGGTYTDSVSNKSKYMRQQTRRIKNQLRLEEEQQKRERRELKDLSIIFEKSKSKSKGNGLKKKLTKRLLQIMAQKFSDYDLSQSNPEYKGPRLSIRQIGSLFELGQSTIHKLYSEWVEDPAFSNRINKQMLKTKGIEKKLTLDRLEHLARLIKDNPFMTQNELTTALNKIDDLKTYKDGQKKQITRTIVSRLLKCGKFKKKRVKCVPKEKNTSKSLENRFNYCSKYKQIWQKRAKVYFLDESGFNLYMTRDKAWARPNEQITVNCPINKGKRFSLIAIIAQDGLTHWRIIEGTYRKYEFIDFIRQLFTRIRQQMDDMTQQERLSEDNQREKWLIMDNCAIHDRQQTNKLAQQCNMNVLYLPPYSPQLNPIQMWFSEVKSRVRKTNYSTEKQLLQIMQRILKDYQNYDFSNYFSTIQKHVNKGINRQKF